jgi:carbon-monoxide dehydrogenase large subunit
MIVEGQVHGGIAQGVGQALYEGTVYDKEGQLVTGSYMDYAMPRADYLPSFKVDTTETNVPSNPLGIKGCGEAGAIAAPAAVMNAITMRSARKISQCLPRRGGVARHSENTDPPGGGVI